jgi:hypothetical protein
LLLFIGFAFWLGTFGREEEAEVTTLLLLLEI